jgi:predicted transcriptional regulator
MPAKDDNLNLRDPSLPDPMERSPHAVSDADVLFPNLPAEVVELASTNIFARDECERARKSRLRATAMLMLRHQGYSGRQIAQMLGTSHSAVRMAMVRARREGRLKELQGVLESDSAALAVESLNHHLKKKDKEATFETLRGLGHFRTYSNIDNKHAAGGGVMPPLTVNIVNAPTGQTMFVTAEPMGVAREDAIDAAE